MDSITAGELSATVSSQKLRKIIHVDMDAFYASVEQRDRPELRGKPVAVGGSADGRGVVAAASYEARKHGVHSAMAMRKAVQLCPDLAIVRPRIDYYSKVSKSIHEIFRAYTPIIEPLSLDEAFLDVTATAHLYGGAEKVGIAVKSRIRDELSLVASVGVAPCKFVAKIASDLRKPDAFVCVPPADVLRFLEPLPIERIWGVGKVTARQFRNRSIRTIGELRQLSLETLAELFGNSAQHYWELSHGIDDRPVVCDREAKSISSETTFHEDIADRSILESWLSLLVESVARRLRNQELTGRGIEIKVRYSDFRSITRSMMLQQSTDVTNVFLGGAEALLRTKVPDDGRSVRLIGFGIHHLSHEEYRQLHLLDEEETIKQRTIDAISDTIANRFGRGAIQRGKSKR
jgi:DNA polymerase-4